MRCVSIALLLVVVAMANASGSEGSAVRYYDVNKASDLFEKFIKDHNKQYKDDADRDVHYQAFRDNLHTINELNKKNPSATYGINKFADYTEEERKSMRGFGKP